MVVFHIDGQLQGEPQVIDPGLPSEDFTQRFSITSGRNTLAGSVVLDDAFITSGVYEFK